MPFSQDTIDAILTLNPHAPLRGMMLHSSPVHRIHTQDSIVSLQITLAQLLNLSVVNRRATPKNSSEYSTEAGHSIMVMMARFEGCLRAIECVFQFALLTPTSHHPSLENHPGSASPAGPQILTPFKSSSSSLFSMVALRFLLLPADIP